MRPSAGRRFWLAVSVCLAPVPVLAQQPAENVAVQMRHVDFHVDSSIVLHISSLRGELRPTSPEHSPYLDDKGSFVVGIDSARMSISPASLSDLLNRYTFAYPGSPLHNLTITIERGLLKQRGVLRGISFTIVSDITLTPDGELRLHPSSVKAEGIKVGGLMNFLGLHLEKVAKLKSGRGVRIDKDDFLLSPSLLLPPPSIEGRVAGVEVSDSELVLTFEPVKGEVPRALTVPSGKAENYMFFRGGTLRFGKLTMRDADLMIIDAEPKDPFDFYLDQYQAQLVAGYAKPTADKGLIVVMQDYSRTPPLPGTAARTSGTRRSQN